MLAKESWTRDDAIIAAMNSAAQVPACAAGHTAVLAEAGVGEMEWLAAWVAHTPYFSQNAMVKAHRAGLKFAPTVGL